MEGHEQMSGAFGELQRAEAIIRNLRNALMAATAQASEQPEAIPDRVEAVRTAVTHLDTATRALEAAFDALGIPRSEG